MHSSLSTLNSQPLFRRKSKYNAPSAEYHIVRHPSNYQTMLNDAFKALSDPSRRQILARLRAEGELTAGQIAEQFDMTKPTMSHHFAVLKEAGLVKSRRDGQQIIYSLNTTVMEDVMGLMLDLFQTKPSKNGSTKKRSDT